MFYQESTEILKEIQKAKKILTNCHQNPDWDSVGSALAIKTALEPLGKQVSIISPVPIPEPEIDLPGARDILPIDYETFPFNQWDLFILIDIPSPERLTASKTTWQPNGIRSIVIDHHPDNVLKGVVKLVRPECPATAIILFNLFRDWKFRINSGTATNLFTGLVGDTLFFKTPSTTPEALHIASNLLKLGANKDNVTRLLYNNFSQNAVNLLGLIFQNTRVDSIGNFAWSAVDYQSYKKFGKPTEIKSIALDSFVNSIKGTRFSLVIVEMEQNLLGVSFRSNNDIDVGILAKNLGGGGHPRASATRIEGEFNTVIKRILETAREFAKKQK